MNKIIQIVLVAFIVSFPNNNSNAFISAATKGGQLLSKIGIFKKAAPAAKVGLIDEVARESIKLKNINKSLIDEIDLNEKEKIFSSIKNSDEIAFQDYKNYDQEYSGVKLSETWRLIHARRVDITPEPSIYACETDSSVYYFSLLPKKNKAFVTSSDQSVENQRLKVIQDNFNGTVLSSYEQDLSKLIYFILLPNYKAIIKKRSEIDGDKILETQNLEIMSQYINGRCYDTDLKSKNLIRFEIDETSAQIKRLEKEMAEVIKDLPKEDQSILKDYLKDNKVETASKSNVKKLTPNLSRFVILIVGLYIFLTITLPILDGYLRKTKKRLKILMSIYPYANALNNIVLNMLGWTIFFMLFTFVYPWWAIVLLVLFLIYFFGVTVTNFKAANAYFTLIKEIPSQKDPQLALSHSFQMIIPIIFLVSVIVFLIYSHYFL